jgi:ribonuclease/clavin/mitogillin
MGETFAGSVTRTVVPARTWPPYTATNCYWIRDVGGVWLLDTGDGSPEGRRALAEAHRGMGHPRVYGILLTHWHRDHSGGAAWASQAFHAPVYAWPEEIPALHAALPDLAVAAWPADGRPGGAVALRAPGHTHGQLNLWFPALRLLLAGDNVLGDTTALISTPDGDLGTYLATLAELDGLGPAVIGPGHGSWVEPARIRLHAYVDHRAKRHRQVLHLLAGGPATAADLATAIYGAVSTAAVAAGVRMVETHLATLEREGRVIRWGDGRYRLTGDAGHAPRDTA